MPDQLANFHLSNQAIDGDVRQYKLDWTNEVLMYEEQIEKLTDEVTNAFMRLRQCKRSFRVRLIVELIFWNETTQTFSNSVNSSLSS